MTAKSIMGLIPNPPGKITDGKILFKGSNLAALKDKDLRKIRGADISMIFQDPMTALNPTLTIGTQLVEGIIQHQKISRSEAQKKALEMMRLVGIPSTESRLKQYPHQFSGE